MMLSLYLLLGPSSAFSETDTVSTAGAAAPRGTPLPPPAVAQCGKWQHGMNLDGHVIIGPSGSRSTPTSSAGECCDKCKRTAGCLGWTWNGPSDKGCYCKNENVRLQQGAKQQVSSVLGPGPPLPLPRPPPPPVCSSIGPWKQCPWFDQALPRSERVSKLVGAMTLEEKLAQLDTDTPAIPRLAVPSYHWRNNILHGTVDNGVSTQFPQSVGMAASFDVDALHAAARVMSDEQRAKHNIKLRETGGNSVMDYGLDLWGPNINMFRDPRWGRGQETYGEGSHPANWRCKWGTAVYSCVALFARVCRPNPDGSLAQCLCDGAAGRLSDYKLAGRDDLRDHRDMQAFCGLLSRQDAATPEF